MANMDNASSFQGVIEAETAKAYFFVFDFDHDKDWIPKSQSSFDQQGLDEHGQRRGTLHISKWLCDQKGLEEQPPDTVDLIERGDRQ